MDRSQTATAAGPLLELDPFAGVCEREIQRGLRDPHRLE
jgi:hypothetical protein